MLNLLNYQFEYHLKNFLWVIKISEHNKKSPSMKIFILCLFAIVLNASQLTENNDNSACVIYRQENNGQFSRSPCSITKIADRQWQINMTFTSLCSGNGAIANKLIDEFSFTDQYGKGVRRNISVETLANSHPQGEVIKNNHIVALGKNQNAYDNKYYYTADLCYYHCVQDPILRCMCDSKVRVSIIFEMNTTKSGLRVEDGYQGLNKDGEMVQLMD